MFHCLLTYVHLIFHFQCKPELKVPGLYVVDSIVRQSRHQFGVDKDVFGPRFLKNFTDTFQNLYHCPEDDKVIIFWLAVQEINEKTNRQKKHHCFIMGWLLFFLLLEQNSSCSEPVAKEWCVWHGHHSAFDGYGERSHYHSSCFGRSIHFSSSLKCMCSCLNKCTWCVC